MENMGLMQYWLDEVVATRVKEVSMAVTANADKQNALQVSYV